MVGSLELQTEFPNPAVAIGAEPFRLDVGFAHILLWVAVAIGVVVIALYLRDVLPGGLARRRRWEANGDELGEAGGGAGRPAHIAARAPGPVGRLRAAMTAPLLQRR